MVKCRSARARVARLQKTLCGKPVAVPGMPPVFACVLKRGHAGPCCAAKVLMEPTGRLREKEGVPIPGVKIVGEMRPHRKHRKRDGA